MIDPVTSPLEIFQEGEPCLRQKARELSKEEILSSDIQNLIERMKITMRLAPGVGLAAPQVGRSIQLAVIEDRNHYRLTEEQLKERERTIVPFHVIINPRLYPEGEETVSFYEGCLSIPGKAELVSRMRCVRVECLNEKAEAVTIHAVGWYARILQHEIDHLQAILYPDRV